MPIPEKFLADFEEEEYYHIYNKTNNTEKLFQNDENRLFFLRRYRELLSPFLNTYCWSLLPNHFHLLIRVRAIAQIKSYLNSLTPQDLTLTEKKFIIDEITLSELMEQEFKRFFQSYAMAYNKMSQRKGNLFYKPFKRLKVLKEPQFTMTIIYIHANAFKHRIVDDFTAYQWSSWHTSLSEEPTSLMRKEVIEWFGNKEKFIEAHREMVSYYYNPPTALED